jgi:hypothetical protein
MRSESSYIDENTIIIISSLIGFTIVMRTFLKILTDSFQAKKDVEEKLIIENDIRLNEQLATKDRELTFQALMLANNSESSGNLIAKLNELKLHSTDDNKRFITQLISDVKFSEKKDVWEGFQLRFSEVHPNFSTNLMNVFPNLTKGDLKLASLLKLDLSSKKIAMLTGNTRESVDVSRSRLRKKMNLTSLDNIVSVLSKY